MAHNLTINQTTGQAEMAFVGDLPWHKLGTKLPSLATAQEMIEAASLGWLTHTDHVFRFDPVTFAMNAKGWFERNPNCDTLPPGLAQAEDYQFSIRSDNGAILGVTTPDYTPVSNVDCFRLADAITLDPNGPKYETAGSLHGGKRVWALARLPEWIEVLPGDEMGQYLLITTGHDGKNALRMMLTNIRVVCNNTLTAATRDENRGVRLTHTADIMSRADDVRAQLGIFHKEARESAELYRALAKQQVTADEIDITLKALFGEAGPNAQRDTSGAKRAKVLELMEVGKGADIKGVRGTAWGLYNAIAEYCDHYHGATGKSLDSDDRRLASMWFGGTIEKRKNAAIELLASRL